MDSTLSQDASKPTRPEAPINPIRARACSLLQAGISFIPVGSDKRPAFDRLPAGIDGKPSWDIFTTELPTADEIDGWFADGAYGIAVVNGLVSSNLETVDFDLPEGYSADHSQRTCEAFLVQAEQLLPGISNRLQVTKTRKGFHIRFRCVGPVEGNQKLANVPKLNAEGSPDLDRLGRPKKAVLIETRGEGGYALEFPTPGYTHHAGPNIEDALRITGDERRTLLAIARILDGFPEEQQAESIPAELNLQTGDDLRPGDDYNARARWEDLLPDLGLEVIDTTPAGVTRLHRKGSGNLLAATINFKGTNRLHVFSSNLDLDAEQSYSKFAVYARLQHDGDFSDATKALRSQGYGSLPKITQPGSTHCTVQPKTSSSAAGKKSAMTTSLQFVRACDVEPKEVQWLWPGRIPLGKMTLIGGDPGLGKSHLTVDIAARVTTGRNWPDGSPGCDPGSVIIFSAEDDADDTIVPRLIAAGADLQRVHIFKCVKMADAEGNEAERGFDMTTDLPILKRAAEEISDVKLEVIDPVSSYTGKTDSHKNAEVRVMLSPLADLAATYDFSVVSITHLNKSGGGKAVYRSTGSLAFAAAARAVWMFCQDLDDKNRRLLLPVKCNLAKTIPGLAMTIENGPAGSHIRWEANPVEMTGDEYLRKEADSAGSSDQDRGELHRACDLLLELLNDGPIPSNDMKEAATAHGITPATLKRAREQLNVKATKCRESGKWAVSLPEGLLAHTIPHEKHEPHEPHEPLDFNSRPGTTCKRSEGAQEVQGAQENHHGHSEPVDDEPEPDLPYNPALLGGW
ncbi:AAA family ATPase [Planctellipticum variicoloris]|uniref:AAA family ATPase n=1 Tax=Planctellipticum variicoloris TaxID=3064265 RepID=UPI003013FBD0|nr:AAA family ATPase [Planctomycetaceae bacterium SH412]